MSSCVCVRLSLSLCINKPRYCFRLPAIGYPEKQCDKLPGRVVSQQSGKSSRDIPKLQHSARDYTFLQSHAVSRRDSPFCYPLVFLDGMLAFLKLNKAASFSCIFSEKRGFLYE